MNKIKLRSQWLFSSRGFGMAEVLVAAALGSVAMLGAGESMNYYAKSKNAELSINASVEMEEAILAAAADSTAITN